MRRLTLLLLLFLPTPVRAQGNDLLSVPGLAQAASDAAKLSKAVGMAGLDGRTAVGIMVPLRTWHDLAGINYATFGPGAVIKKGEHFRFRVVALVDLSALVRRLESSSAWYSARTFKVTLPDFWVGPQVQLPTQEDNFTWSRWREFVGGSVAVGF